MSTPTSAIPWSVFLERFKTFLDYGKDTAELIAKFSLLLLVLPGLTLWLYLNRIGWHTLFLDSISSTSGLLALLIGTLLLVSALLFALSSRRRQRRARALPEYVNRHTGNGGGLDGNGHRGIDPDREFADLASSTGNLRIRHRSDACRVAPRQGDDGERKGADPG